MEISQQWPQPKCFIEFSDFSALPSCQNASTDDSTTTTFGRGKDLMINTLSLRGCNTFIYFILNKANYTKAFSVIMHEFFFIKLTPALFFVVKVNKCLNPSA